MVKVASTLLVGAALVASSAPALAAPTRYTARSDVVANPKDVEVPEEADVMVGDNVAKRNSLSQEPLEKRGSKPTSTDRIRRGLALAPESTLADLDKRDLITDLGLDGTLAPLGLGDLVPTLTGAIKGLPVVGEPVGGLVGTVDNTVGVTKLLQPKGGAAPAGAAPAPAPAPAKRDLLSSLTGTVGGTVGSLPVVGGVAGGVLNTASGAVGGSPLGGLLGQVQGNGQLQALLGQLQSLGLGNLPISQLQSAVGGTPAGSAYNTASSTAGSAAGGLMNQLSIAQAEQLGLLAPGTARSLLATIEATVNNEAVGAATAGTPAANAFKVAPHGFKASGNETASAAPSSSTTSSAAPGEPTFTIAPPSAVASAMAQGNGNSFAAQPDAADELEDDDEDNSASEYSDDSIFSDDDDEMADDPDADHHVGLEGQGPNASGSGASWHTASSTTAGESATATAEAMSLSYSDASATAVPTSTGNAKRWAVQLD
ncbi:hypothetical protein JCM10207_001881 [Rhodosporidiobolus poonsookiae]